MLNPQSEFTITDLVDEPEGSVAEVISTDSSLPVKFFNMTANPFLDSVNPDFFFRTEAHEEAFVKLKSCIDDNVSIGLCTALSGTGKTLLSQILLTELDLKRCKPVLILVYPSMSPTALLREIAAELQLEDAPANARTAQLVSLIQDEIMRLHLESVKLVLIIDEVHFLSAQALHLLRTLSNIEIPSRKLLTILLFGEETFLKRMHRPGYRALFSRMFIRTKLRPLNENEVEQYIKFRLLTGGAALELFDPKTFPLIHRMTGGIPREVNRLCHNTLMWTASHRRQQVTVKIIETVKARHL